MSPPTPTSLSEPMPSALARAISWAETAEDSGSSFDRDRAVMWATVVQAQEAYRTRREVRGLADQVKRLTRGLTEEAEA